MQIYINGRSTGTYVAIAFVILLAVLMWVAVFLSVFNMIIQCTYKRVAGKLDYVFELTNERNQKTWQYTAYFELDGVQQMVVGVVPKEPQKGEQEFWISPDGIKVIFDKTEPYGVLVALAFAVVLTIVAYLVILYI